MKKNVVVISSSLRENSNSEILAREFAKGAEKENHVEWINLKEYELHFCRGCLACQRTGECVIQDEIKEVIEKIKNAEIVAFASPIYYYSISGQLKTLLDRLNPLYVADYKFRKVYLLATCADENEEAINGAKIAIEGWVECFPKAKLVETFCGVGCEFGKDILKQQETLKKIKNLGESV